MYKLRENVLNELACPLVYHVALSSHNCAEITCVSCLLETGARLRGALPIDAALRCGARRRRARAWLSPLRPGDHDRTMQSVAGRPAGASAQP